VSALARADLNLFALVRSAARPPVSDLVGRFSSRGEHARLWLAMGALGALVDRTPAAMAASRVHLGVHYPTDVAAGALLGLAMGSAAR
jgi:membrane-associated phospholipid phosphatase